MQELCVALTQTPRQRVGDPRAQGQEGQGNETGESTDRQHVLVFAVWVPASHLAVRLHGADAVRVHVALQRLCNGRAHRNVDGHEHRTHSPEEC